MKIWKKRGNASPTDIDQFALELKGDKLKAALLLSRGIHTREEAVKFFRPQLEDLHDPFLLKDCDKAVTRLIQAKANNERILVYGDYDVDGTSAVSLMTSFLESQGFQIDYYIPDRYTEGYGFSNTGVSYAIDNEFNLIITLDCGIKDGERILRCNENSIDVIVCDHHTPEILPAAFAVINPKRTDCNYPNKGLCGCAVGFKLVCAYLLETKQDLSLAYDLLDFVAIATAADIVPLTPENRILVTYGLNLINRQKSHGIRALLSNAKYEGKELKVSDLVFLIAPRINAAGRIFSGRKAVEVMLSKASEQATTVASEIEKYNLERRELDQGITQEAFTIIENDPFYANSFTTVVKNQGWHKGVVGIVASRLIEKIYKPTLVLVEEDGILSGSARSIEGIDIYEPLAQCEEYLIQFGGHTMAAGLKLKAERFIDFRAAFDKAVKELCNGIRKHPVMEYDAEVNFDALSLDLLKFLEPLEPHGPENPRPVFLSRNIKNARFTKLVGANADHLSLHVTQEGNASEMKGIAFKMANWCLPILEGKKVDLLYTLRENVYNGTSSLQMEVVDIRLAEMY
jgi:single-stranded-DNA-specific exonuclease